MKGIIMAKKLDNKKKSGQKSTPSKTLLTSIDAGSFSLKIKVPKQGPHKLRIVT
jgi:hypothetical protein